MSKMDTDTKISYKEKMEEEYKILCSICRKYKYRVEYKFDQFLSIRNMRYGVTKSSLAKEFFYMVIYCMVRAV